MRDTDQNRLPWIWQRPVSKMETFIPSRATCAKSRGQSTGLQLVKYVRENCVIGELHTMNV